MVLNTLLLSGNPSDERLRILLRRFSIDTRGFDLFLTAETKTKYEYFSFEFLILTYMMYLHKRKAMHVDLAEQMVMEVTLTIMVKSYHWNHLHCVEYKQHSLYSRDHLNLSKSEQLFKKD
jgi:hypothetical protein